MSKRKILKYLVWFLVAVVFAFWVRSCVRVDTCLDRGGAWDYEEEMCVGASNK